MLSELISHQSVMPSFPWEVLLFVFEDNEPALLLSSAGGAERKEEAVLVLVRL